jgi:hypothetical protein
VVWRCVRAYGIAIYEKGYPFVWRTLEFGLGWINRPDQSAGSIGTNGTQSGLVSIVNGLCIAYLFVSQQSLSNLYATR